MEHEKDGDLGYNWLKTNYAGVGPFKFGQWRPNELLTLERNDGYWGGAPAMKRVVIRHIADQATQQLMLETGATDIARTLGPDQPASLRDTPEIPTHSTAKGTVYYLAFNKKNELKSNPKRNQPRTKQL